MTTSFKHALAFLALATAIAAPVDALAADKLVQKEQYSGFLKDYSQLREEKDAAGQPVMRHISPKMSSGAYSRVMVDRVEFYPAPQPDEYVDMATLNRIRDYFDKALRQKIGERVPLADQAGPGVVRMRVAITAVAAETVGLKPRGPAGLIIQGIKASTGSGPLAREAELYAELEVLDSQSGQRLGAVVKRGTGTEVKAQTAGEEKKVALENVKPVLDNWVRLAADFAGSNLRPR